jgi:hypothetical protein
MESLVAALSGRRREPETLEVVLAEIAARLRADQGVRSALVASEPFGVLLSLLSEDGYALESQCGAIRILGALEDPRAVEPLLECLRWGTLRDAAHALAAIGDPRAIGPLSELLEEVAATYQTNRFNPPDGNNIKGALEKFSAGDARIAVRAYEDFERRVQGEIAERVLAGSEKWRCPRCGVALMKDPTVRDRHLWFLRGRVRDGTCVWWPLRCALRPPYCPTRDRSGRRCAPPLNRQVVGRPEHARQVLSLRTYRATN